MSDAARAPYPTYIDGPRRPDKTRQRRIRLQLPEKAIMPHPVYSAGEA
ncbi:hypothetical protein HMPREF1612_00616 [Escherichia coli 908585]|nr:hypothetical protein HMPREF1606_03738 [Escherichia coli 908522]ESD95580.1 hypothetical protein HMPREF1612_00616 [Escherichia coli 908585]